VTEREGSPIHHLGLFDSPSSAGDATSAVLSVRKASHRRASSDLRRDGRCELTRAFACASIAPVPLTPAIARAYDEKISLCEAPHLGAADNVPKQSSAHHAETGDTMRKSILFVAIVVVTATAAVWSIATFARSKGAGPVQATETSAPVSPHEIMVKQGRSLPVEYWAHPF